MGKLSAKQAKFVEEYLIDLNAAAAARRAGYSVNTAKVIGHENLTKPYIQEAIKERREQIAAEQGVTPEKVVEEIASIAFANADPDERLRYSDKQKALEMLARHLGLFEKDNAQRGILVLSSDPIKKPKESGLV